MKKFAILIFIILNLSLNATDFTIKSTNNEAKNILKKYLKKIDFQIENQSNVNFILKTKNQLSNTEKKFFEKLSSYKNDAFSIKLINKNLYIVGINNRSMIYGIYKLLKRNFKCKFLTEDFEIIPKEVFIKSDDILFETEARFQYREIFIKELENDTFALKLALNGKLGHKVKQKNKNFRNIYNNFTPYELIKLKYKQLYPDFFCAGQLDFSSNKVKEYAGIAFNKKSKYIKVNKEDIFFIQHEDRESFCNSYKNKKLIKKYTSKGSAFFEYVNYIAKENPTKNIFYEAYQWSRKAPKSYSDIQKNMSIFFSNIESNFSKPLVSSENKNIYKDLKSWTEYDNDIFIWHYISNFNGYLQPFPNIIATIKDIKTYNSIPQIKGIFLQGSYESKYSDFSALRAWVFSELLWNPKVNEKELILEFINNYYGEGKNEVLKYFNLLEKEAKKETSKLFVKTSVNSSYLSPQIIIKAKKLLDSALLKVDKNSIYYKHINEIYSSIDYIQLLKGTISEERKNKFKNFLKNNKIKYHAEGRKIVALSPYFKIKRITPKTPKIITKSDTLIWKDYQEYELKLCCSKTIEDKKASSHSAVRMNGDTSEWGIQLDLKTLPKGKWKIYANIRIKKSKNLSRINFIKPAIYYGITSNNIKNLSLINTLKDEEYHEVYVGKINIENNQNGQIWFRPPNSKDVKYIYVDRIFIIKE